MNNVQKLNVNVLDETIYYGSEGKSNITPEMRQKWDEAFSKLDKTLRENGFLNENTSVVIEDNFFSFIFNEELSFENGLAILHTLEEVFNVTYFSFNSEYDEWDEEEPNIHIGFYTI